MNFKLIVVAFVVAVAFSSCVVRRPMPQQAMQGGDLTQIVVKKATFEANIDARQVHRRQEVCDWAAVRFEQTGLIPTSREATNHFGFEAHVRVKPGTGGIQSRTIRPTEAPPNIQAMFQ